LAGPSDIVPLEDVSEVAPEHAEVRPLLSELDGVAYGGAVTADATTTGDGVDAASEIVAAGLAVVGMAVVGAGVGAALEGARAVAGAGVGTTVEGEPLPPLEL
jgi:hypothetical protein